MSPDIGTDWMETAIADLENRKAKIDAAIATIRELQAQGGGSAPSPLGPGGIKGPDLTTTELLTTT